MVTQMTSTKPKVLVAGLGLMGGSLAKCLRRSRNWIVVGYDPDPARTNDARREGSVDHLAEEFAKEVHDADLVVLAGPVGVILDQLRGMSSMPAGKTVVMDLGSTKRQICAAMEGLPEGWEAIGGHPMTGRKTAGTADADPNLFRGRTFVLTTTSRTGERAQELSAQVLNDLGALRKELTAEEHDRAVGLISHLPHFLSVPVLLTVAEDKNPAVWALAAGGLRSVTVAAVDNPIMWRDIARSNQDFVADALNRLARQADRLAERMRNDLVSMEALLAEATSIYQREFERNDKKSDEIANKDRQ